jgi:hypothetical protein
MRLSLGPDLAALKAKATAAIDGQAETALEYQATEAEARIAAAQMAAGQTLDPADFPFVAAEAAAMAAVGAGGVTLEMVVPVVIQQADAWKMAGSMIKELRRAAKMMVEAATTPAEVIAAQRIPWPRPDTLGM